MLSLERVTIVVTLGVRSKLMVCLSVTVIVMANLTDRVNYNSVH